MISLKIAIMRTFKAATLGLLGAASFAVASDVVQLTKDDFDSFMNEHDLVLAECKFTHDLYGQDREWMMADMCS